MSFRTLSETKEIGQIRADIKRLEQMLVEIHRGDTIRMPFKAILSPVQPLKPNPPTQVYPQRLNGLERA